MDFFTSKDGYRDFQRSAAKWCRTKQSRAKLSIFLVCLEEMNVQLPSWACKTKPKAKRWFCLARWTSISRNCATSFTKQMSQICGFPSTSSASKQYQCLPQANSI